MKYTYRSKLAIKSNRITRLPSVACLLNLFLYTCYYLGNKLYALCLAVHVYSFVFLIYLQDVSPVAVELEVHVMDWMAQRMGLPDHLINYELLLLSINTNYCLYVVDKCLRSVQH